MAQRTRTALVIGAGQTGASAAYGLQRAGFQTTLISERDQRSLRDDVPATGTAALFGQSIEAERELGLDTYLDRAPVITGQSVRLVDGSQPQRPEHLAFDAEFPGFVAVAVDTRLKADERITAFLDIGGELRVEKVEPDRLDELAGRHDLVLVATGRDGLGSLFPVDPARTAYQSPQRRVLMVTLTGLGHGPEVFAHRSAAGGRHSSFSFVTDQGEAWWGPYLHKDAGPSWAFLAWGKPGSDWERRFTAPTNLAQAHQAVLELHRDYLDWDLAEAEALRTIADDPRSWLSGAITPLVRRGTGRTASGHAVAALGDAAVAYDPIAGQGAQTGLLHAAFLVRAASAHNGPFDGEWLTAVFEEFYADRIRAAYEATRLYLGDPDYAEANGLIFGAAQVRPAVAGAAFALLSDPRPVLAFDKPHGWRQFVANAAGEDPDALLARFTPAGRFQRSAYGAAPAQ
ncbi:FAD dependent oxidoreductase [Segniliparus rotundus DSM 44985]|uniref:FAD dependent oxidoreductase n=1 Tax=Segniliparus rotundus (strain ATCC BAA-972 / CDC 1076 / CIP 108378 / DSM 44985 / JCM 13578) TaxID=640132 RepID=D6ZBN7_SEGRD|nr:styrene monooxygenase/indole monooxygenase family protein [Segniliparus rotundus]ADG98989.1 FAD dependent oxidoreductase [Segniliparus rotundus DSM 44985]